MNNRISFSILVLVIATIYSFVNVEALKILTIIFYLLIIFTSFKSSIQRCFENIFLIAGLDMFFKITSSFPSWESNKIVLVVMSLIVFFKSSQKKSIFLLFIPFVILSSWIFSSGEKSALQYFYPWFVFALVWISINKQNFSLDTFFQKEHIWFIGFFITSIFLLINKLDFSSLDYGSGRFSNNDAIGFSANQFTNFSSILIIYTFWKYFVFKKKKFDVYFYLGSFVLFFFSLASLSRGGFFILIVSLTPLIIYYRRKIKIKNAIYTLSLITFSILFVNEISKGALSLRFIGKSEMRLNTKKSDFTTGRLLTQQGDYITFSNNAILGVGTGNSGKYNEKINIKSHNEFFRFLAEHGALGIICILILFYNFIFRYEKGNNKTIYISSILLLLSFLSQGSTRLILPFIIVILANSHYNKQ